MLKTQSIALAGVVLAHFWADGVATPTSQRAVDPCSKIAGRSFVIPADARACLNSFPYNATLAKNVMDVVGGGKSIAHNLVERALICAIAINFATFEEWQKFTPFPFTEASVNLDVEFVRIKRTRYKTDYQFNRDLSDVIQRLDDGHTTWTPYCYSTFQNILPAPVVALEKNGLQEIYIAPDAVEFISLLGSNYTLYYDRKGFNRQEKI